MKIQVVLISVLLLFISSSALLFTRALDPSTGSFQLENMKPGQAPGDKERDANAAVKWRYDRLKDENGNFNPSYMINAMKEADAFRQSSSRSGALGLQWQEMGPDNVGGRTRAILIDKRDASNNTIYAGGVGGGMWKSTDGANTWTRLSGWNQWLAIASIIQGPAPDYTIYIGTGEGLSEPGASSYNSGTIGDGIFKLDANDNPIRVTPDIFANAPLGLTSPWACVNRIAVNPINEAQIAAATLGGVYESMDTGNTWTVGYAALGEADDVKWTSDGHHIFASVGGLFNSTLVTQSDTGRTWIKIGTHNYPGFPAGALGRVEIALAPSDPNVVYILAASTSNCTQGVYRSVDAGNTWSTIATGGPLFQIFEDGGSGCQGWYDNVISVSPGDADKFYMGGVSFYTGSISSGVYAADVYFGNAANPFWIHADKHCITIAENDSNLMYVGCDGGIFKSVNALSAFPFPTYTPYNRGYNVTQNYGIAAGINGDVIGGAQDNGTNWVNFVENTPMAGQQVLGGDGILNGVSHLDPSFYFGGVYYADLIRTSNYWNSANTFFDIKIDPLAQGTASACNANMANGDAQFITPFILAETKTAANGYDSVKFIADINYLSGSVVTVNSATASYPFQYSLTSAVSMGDTIMIPDPVRSRIMLATFCGAWVTSQPLVVAGQPQWFRLTSGNLVGDPEFFASSTDGNVLYVSTSAGYVYKFPGFNAHCDTTTYTAGTIPDVLYTSDTQYVMRSVANGRTIEGIAVDPQNNNHVVATVAGFSSASAPHVYESTNGGASWHSDVTGLPNMPVYTAVIHDSTTIIVGSELGIWSWDGTSWHEENDGYLGNASDGFPRTPVYRMVESNLYTDGCPVLYVGSHGRGMWRSTTLTPTSCQTAVGTAVNNIKSTSISGLNVFPNPVHNSAKVELTLDNHAPVTLRVFDMSGRLYKEIAIRNAVNGENIFDLDASGFASGTYLLTATVADTRSLSRLFVVSK